MIVNGRAMLEKADRERFAVGGFNITSLETALGIVAAAEAEKSPVILQISEKTIEYMSLEVAFAIAQSLASKAKIPIAIHFDHGRNFELVRRSIQIGFSSVMLDVSKLPEAERIDFVRKFVLEAHGRNVTVEVEEDVIGGREDYVDGVGWKFTDPSRAASFVQATQCDSFAVSIGNSHGKALPNEEFDVGLLKKIDRAVSLPLVLHGASSTPSPLIRQAIASGICKINIDTDLRVAFTNQLRSTIKDDEIYDPRDVLQPSIAAVQKAVVEKIRLFGSNGKA